MSAGVLENIGIKGENQKKKIEINHDAHDVGGNAATYFFTQYYKGILSGLEFIQSFFQSKETSYVLHLASEFSRSAKSDGSCSDHGTNSSVHTIISDQISGNQSHGKIGCTGIPGDTYYGS